MARGFIHMQKKVQALRSLCLWLHKDCAVCLHLSVFSSSSLVDLISCVGQQVAVVTKWHVMNGNKQNAGCGDVHDHGYTLSVKRREWRTLTKLLNAFREDRPPPARAERVAIRRDLRHRHNRIVGRRKGGAHGEASIGPVARRDR